LVKSTLLKTVHHHCVCVCACACEMQYHDCNEVSASTTFTFMSITSWSTLQSKLLVISTDYSLVKWVENADTLLGKNTILKYCK
jgi:hypothetical protein